MKKNPNVLWFSALLLGWLFDFLFWGQSTGINFTIYAALCLSGGLLLLWWWAKLPPARPILWLVPPLAFFIFVPFVRAEPMTVFLSILFTIMLGGLAAVSYLGGRWLHYSLADYISRFAVLFGSMVGRPMAFSIETRREEMESGTVRPRLSLWPIIRGIVITIPIVGIFAALLASADAIFSRNLNDFIKLFFEVDKIPEYIFRLVYILIIAYALAGVLLQASAHSRDEVLLGVEKPWLPRFLGFAETTIILGSVIVLFTAFVVVQFRYFFGGQANLGPGGLTDSEYARRGFGELAAVAFLSLLLILGLSTVTNRRSPAQRRIFSGLSVTVVALVMVILVSAYQRLQLNELAHGFFRLRTYSHVFYIWLALLLIAVMVLEVLHRERAFALAALIASLGFAISLTVLNVDRFTAQQSVIRATQGYYFNIPDIAALSTDSEPALVDAFLSPSVPASVREQIGVILVCRAYMDPETAGSMGDWRSFNLSRWSAAQALERARPYLKDYVINTQTYPMRVRTVGHSRFFECQNRYGD